MSRNRRLALVAFVALVVGLAIPAGAGATTTVVKEPFDLTVEACGETITLSGTLLTVVTEQQLQNGGFLFTIHFQPQGVTGTSSSGIPYHGTGLTRDTTVTAPSGDSRTRSSTASTSSERRGRQRSP
jgi:hypothetical protein